MLPTCPFSSHDRNMAACCCPEAVSHSRGAGLVLLPGVSSPLPVSGGAQGFWGEGSTGMLWRER